ncbi:MAG: YqaA family protein [Candidatus Cryptobacteroides sp.]|nr:DedA family protein [Bacteroidales bacterium]MDY2774581.1 YqaA family protein [Candidatus Cryptobacteroides sp.]
MFDLESLGLLGLFIGTFLAATILPFSSDALYIAVLAATKDPIGCLAVGTVGNWLGSVVTYWIGWIGRWEWIEKWFKVKRETLEKQKVKIDKYGVWLALLAWIPIIGDVIAIALGFYRTRPWATMFLLLVGKFARFLLWNLVYGLF